MIVSKRRNNFSRVENTIFGVIACQKLKNRIIENRLLTRRNGSAKPPPSRRKEIITSTARTTSQNSLWDQTPRGRATTVGNDNKMKSTQNGKKGDGTFRSKKIKHDPNAESARAVFGMHGKAEDRH